MRTLTLIALVALVGCSGGEPSEPSESKTLVTGLSGSSFLCPTENMVLRIEESIESLNKPKLDMLIEQGCFSAEPNVDVTFIGGSFSSSTRNVRYKGKSVWAYGETVGYWTSTQRTLYQAWSDCEETNKPYGSVDCREYYDAMMEGGI